MGEIANTDNGNIIREVDEQRTDDRGSNQSGSSTDATTKGRTGRGNNRGSGTTGRGTTETKQKEVVSGLSVLDEKEKKRLERNEKRRQRYHEQKAKGELPTQAKPKKVNKKAAKKDDTVDASQLNILIKTISTLIASRPNCSHWLLSDAEIESITTPLAKMLKESEVFEKLGEHSNQIALATACITVFVPRIVQTTMLAKEKKKHERAIKQQQGTNQAKVVELNRHDDKRNRNADDGTNNGTNEHWTSTLVY